MKRTISIGTQDFEKLRTANCFYIDKTDFIREWWDSEDDVTLITRPRRFGKTLNMSMLHCFFSNRFENRGDLFEGLSIWQEERFRKLQGTFPVIFLSFAGVKQNSFDGSRYAINELIARECNRYAFLMDDTKFSDADRRLFGNVTPDMNDAVAATSLRNLCEWMERYYGQKALILLDEYDTPLQEAYLGGYWDEMVSYIRNLFNNTFKTNPSLGRAIMTGITRVSKESIFSDLNNLTVITTTSSRYATCFGFTEDEVFQALEDQGYDASANAVVKEWYDGFTFGNQKDIYNPWSLTNYLKEGKLDTYWANSSGNGLISHLLRRGKPQIKVQFETLLQGGQLQVPIDEQIIFDQLDRRENAIWSLLLATGYLKADEVIRSTRGRTIYRLSITNFETMLMFEDMVSGWFEEGEYFNEFVGAMLRGDEFEMNEYMRHVMENICSSFDSGNKPSEREPERFYHGFVLGLLVDQSPSYLLRSNRESGYGRYDVVLEPKEVTKPAIVIEFKVFNPNAGEKTLADTAANALKQIEEKKYDTDLITRGLQAENILKYGFAFQGKSCLIRKA